MPARDENLTKIRLVASNILIDGTLEELHRQRREDQPGVELEARQSRHHCSEVQDELVGGMGDVSGVDIPRYEIIRNYKRYFLRLRHG